MRKDEDQLLTVAKLKTQLNYDPSTGAFTWKIGKQGTRGVGSTAGTLMDRYWSICINGRSWKAHRLAWLWMTGRFPPAGMQVDHINGAALDNRIENLRIVSQEGNMQNMRILIKKTASGYLGVTPAGKKWAASIRTNGARRYLGSFETPEEAHRQYLQAKRSSHLTCTV